MAGNYAVLVDTGFLMAEGAKALGLSRKGLAFDGAACVAWFNRFRHDRRYARTARLFGPRSFLRAYWYDAAHDPSDRRFETQRRTFDELAEVPGLYLRLGYLQELRPGWQRPVRKAVQACDVSMIDFEKHFTFRPELTQKGVDALMTLDLVNLSRDRVVDAVLLISGDRDLEEAVRVAQGVGCKIALAHPPGAGVATTLRHLADARLQIEPADLRRMLVPIQSSPPPLAVVAVRSAQTP